MGRSVSCVNCETMLTLGSKPDRRRPETDALAFSYDAGDILLLGEVVSGLLGRPLSQKIYYVVITFLMD